MKPLIGIAFAAIPLTAIPLTTAIAAPPTLAPFPCPPCPIQSKAASVKTPGQFDYKMKCFDAVTGNSAVLNITAKNDGEALHTAWQSPRLDEVIVGLEANSYVCAEPPPRSK